jgi:hypothetical protein
MNYTAARESIDRSPVRRLTPFIKGRTIPPWCGTAIAWRGAATYLCRELTAR